MNLEENDTEILFRTLNARIAERRTEDLGLIVNVDDVVIDVFANIEGP